MQIQNINDFDFHDSYLLRIEPCDLTEAADEFGLVIDHVVDDDSLEIKRKRLVFKRCWTVSSILNFRYISRNPIEQILELKESELLDSACRFANIARSDARYQIRHFQIRTSSTGSEINIIAEEVWLLDV